MKRKRLNILCALVILGLLGACGGNGSSGGSGNGSTPPTQPPSNIPPVANDDTAITTKNVTVPVDVLANDTDVDGDPLTVVNHTQGSNGNVVDQGGGILEYTPGFGFSGVDTFNYTISDGTDTDSATVTITVNNTPPVANDDGAATPADTAVQIDVLANDSDADFDPLTVTGFTTPGNGTVTDLGQGVLEYTPNAAFTGTDSFDYTISDGTDTDTATVSIGVGGGPVAVDDTRDVDQNTATVIDVLANDSGSGIFIQTITQPQHGTASIVADTVEYTPNNNYTGPDTFSYTVSNGAGTDTADVDVEVVPVWTVASSGVHGPTSHTGWDVELTDANGSGSPDIITTFDPASQSYGAQVAVFENNSTPGSTTLGTPVDYAANSKNEQIAIGDVNGDGLDDIIVSNAFGGGVTVYLRDPATPGAFLAGQAFGATMNGNMFCFTAAVADVDGDGMDDIIVATTDFTASPIDEVNVLRNTTTAGSTTCTFSLESVDTLPRQAITQLVAGDLNGNGKPDIALVRDAIAFANDSVALYVNTSTTGSVSFGPVQDLTTTGTAGGVALGDLNGDGLLDIAARHDNMVSVWLNQSTAQSAGITLAQRQDFGVVGGTQSSLTIGDLNGDGKNDLVLGGRGTDSVYVLLSRTESGAASATFGVPMAIQVTGMAMPRFVRIGDIDGDGTADVVANSFGTNSSGAVAVIRGQTP